jgi:sulfhydrogenase subunit gamma (sulfur reductase)
MKQISIKESQYNVLKGKIITAHMMTAMEKFFEIELEESPMNYDPGQFVMVSIAGVGEAPISISSSPTRGTTFDIVVRNVGKLTNALHSLGAGDIVGIRGPLGKGFPTDILEGNDLIFVAGGLGIVPLRSLINFVIDNRRNYGKVSILLGCKTPHDILFSDELEQWAKRLDVNFLCTVDKADPDWKGNIGLITSLIPGVTVDIDKTYAVIVGPPIMYKFVVKELLKKGIPADQILMSLERHMKCGVGKCGRCQIGNRYCCQDGAVFSYKELKENIEAL